LASAGNNIDARMARMAITTNNSIKVNAVCLQQFRFTLVQTILTAMTHAAR
jgi:hypothetical protein